MEADGTQDVELLGMEIIRELSVFNEELTKKREQVADQSKKLKENLKESEDLRMKLKKTEGEVEEVRAQLRVRTEATQRLEQYNATLRDTVARLQVQVDTNSEERDRLIQRWHSAEEERQKLKSECEKLQDEVATTNSYKQQCQLLFDQIRTNISRVTSQQELLQKDLSRLEQATQDSLTFSQSVDTRGKLRESQANELALVADQAHTKLVHMSALLTELKKDKNVSVAEKPAGNRTEEFFLEWENYQDTMQKRVEAVMAENGRLMEELALTREAQPLNVCPACLNDIVTK